MRRSLIKKVRQASWRTWVATAVVIVLLVLAQPSGVSWVLGLPLVLLGEAVRLWGAGHLVKTDELIVSGPYAYVQHPLYLGTGLIAPGLLIMGGAPWWLWVAAAAFFFGYYMPRKHRIEGGRLRDIYGEAYDAYAAVTPVMIPYRPPYRKEGATPVKWDLDRVSQNSEDGTAYALLAAAAYMLIKALWF